MDWSYHDGGRAGAGFTGTARDCVVRSIAIAAGLAYRTVYEAINNQARSERPLGRHRRSDARSGVRRPTYHQYLASLGARWVPTMGVGTGCRVHLREGDLPSGRLVVRLSHHLTAVIDGKLYDTHDPSRGGTRCVYGYYRFDEDGRSAE